MDLLVELTKLVLPFVGVMLSFAVAYGAEFFRQKSKSEVANRAINSVENIVQAAVLEAQQTVVDNLKELNGGKLTDEEKVQIKSSVLAAVKARLTEETINELRGITADVEGYLTSLIESHVHIHKEFRGVIGGK
ncbi:MAG: hypothetical protein ACOX4N_05975 [Dethiobacteraceae bacterium]|jgi:uncharacterized protein (UPF0333 family)|nr:hypothetical protein [Candidatus Hydrothermia bacterium]